MIGDLKQTEKIQNKATKLVIKLKNKSCIDRLIYLNLLTLKYTRLRGDMIQVFKITHNIIIGFTIKMFIHHVGRKIKRTIQQYHLIFLSTKYLASEAQWLTKAYFSARIVNIWNS